MFINPEKLRLYAVTDSGWLKDGETLAEQTEKAIQGGATVVQLREKNADPSKMLAIAKDIKDVCLKYNVPLIINDSISLMLECNADGVHLGQDDMDINEARNIIGSEKIIGATVHNQKEALTAYKAGADYLGAGAVFPTGTKSNTVHLSYEELKLICSSVPIPTVAIGGIGFDNIDRLKGSGISGAAVVSALYAQSDIKHAAEKLRHVLKSICGETI